MLSEHFDKPFVLAGQNEISGDDIDNFNEIKEVMKEEQLAAKGYVNVQKKLPPKIPLEHITRK